MERHLDQDLDAIRQSLLRMGGLVESMIADAMQALTERESAKADGVIEQDREVDHLEKAIDEECLRVIARQQPTAGDLRFLASAMKIVTDLERMGDSAKNIAQAVHALNREAPLKPYIDLPKLSRLAGRMVKKSLDAFIQRDTNLARDVWQSDDEVDTLYKRLFTDLVRFMAQDPKTVERAVHLLLVARNLERIADHATNIAEDVIYYLEGVDIRHSATKYR